LPAGLPSDSSHILRAVTMPPTPSLLAWSSCCLLWRIDIPPLLPIPHPPLLCVINSSFRGLKDPWFSVPFALNGNMGHRRKKINRGFPKICLP
jgi:hypothetical protein